MILADNISKAYGDKQVLLHYTQAFEAGKCQALSAPSGMGKTTLLRLILGLEQPDSGCITGVPAAKSALFQEDRLFPELTVDANIRMAVGKRVQDADIAAVLETLALMDSRFLPAKALSGGMARRAALARALLYPGELLTLDEPFNGLDAENRNRAAQAVLEFAKDRTILCVTHYEEDMALLQPWKVHTL